jgi:hypothetical protein
MENQQITKREKKNAQSKIYWAKHSKEINERRKERMICSCGLEICKRHLGDHLKHSKHSKELQKRQDLLEEKTNINIANLITSFLI